MKQFFLQMQKQLQFKVQLDSHLSFMCILCVALSAPTNGSQTTNDHRASSRSRSKSKSPAHSSPRGRVLSVSPSPDRDRSGLTIEMIINYHLHQLLPTTAIIIIIIIIIMKKFTRNVNPSSTHVCFASVKS